MCDYEKFKNIYFALIDIILIFIIGVVHLIFFFYIKQTDFVNIFDAFDSSPLFEFSLGNTCGAKDHIAFHVWQGREVRDYYYSNSHYNSKTEIEDVTEITKINGNYFCFKKILYKDLLYNGQIIKKGESCPQEYKQNCGTIDTLEQQLCIKSNENCPLYDVGIGSNSDKTNYINDDNANIYYNKNNYNGVNKKIIGKLILNEGQPCYKLNEKLWRKFDSDEAGEELLACKLKVFDKLNDDRYDNRGEISYKKIYEDNSGSAIYNLLFKDVDEKLDNAKVTLYKREFLGIDKTCDEETDINKENYEKLRNNQKDEGLCILIESIIIFSIWLGVIIYIIILKCKSRSIKYCYEILVVFLIIYLLLYLICIICQAVFLGRIIKYDISYDCSDEITNEVLRLENLNTKKSIKYSDINLGIDVFFILFNVLAFLIVILMEKYGSCNLNLCFKNKN